MTLEAIGRLIRAPLVVLNTDGRVIDANAHARARFGAGVVSRGDLFADPQALRTLMTRASGRADPVLGALDLARPFEGRGRVRVDVVMLRDRAETAFAVELRETEEDGFAALTQRMQALNAEILVRQRAQAALEEALAHNRLLYSELQHRVKNHLQMMMSLVSAAGRESGVPENRAFVNTLQSKLSALFDAQRLMYARGTTEGMRADQMLESIADTIRALLNPGVAIEISAESLLISNDIAFPVALIANELLTNAAKYGAVGTNTAVSVSLRRSGGEAVLAVRDRGPGFLATPSSRSSSGLGLVRGLCRQIGGRLEIVSLDGANVSVSFPLPEAEHGDN